MKYARFISKFPFTSQSTMQLTNTYKLGLGLIFGAKLYPSIRYEAPLWLSFIGTDTDRFNGPRVVVSDQDDIEICYIRFTPYSVNPETAGDELLLGVATDTAGNYCGNMMADKYLKATLDFKYTPDRNAFILSPSSCVPQCGSSSVRQRIVKTQDGSEITSVICEDVVNVDNGFVDRTPVNKIVISVNGGTSGEVEIDGSATPAPVITHGVGSSLRVIPIANGLEFKEVDK